MVRPGILYYPGGTIRSEHFVPLARGGVVDGDIAWLFAPLYDEAQALGFFEPLSFALEEPDKGVLVPGELFAQFRGDGLSRCDDAQGEAVGFERYALAAQIF